MPDQNEGMHSPEYQETAPSERTQQAGDAYGRTAEELPPGPAPSADSAEAVEGSEEETRSEEEITESRLLQKAQEIYTNSTDYLEANITNIWEKNLAHFNNEHAPNAKFRTQNFKRSRVFRPKTRAMTKASEAALTNAMFSTSDVLDIQPEDPTDPKQIISASVNKEILQYRLDRKMPWYQTVIGSFQTTKVYGLTISFQHWDYHVDTDIKPAFESGGEPMVDDEGYAMGYEEKVVRRDDLCCDLIAPENFRFDPMCDWRDPAGTSPYLLYMMPIYAIDVMERMESDNGKTNQKPWKKYSLGQLLSTRRQNYDRTRQAREGRHRIDPADEQHGSSYTTLWAHMNIVNMNGTDMMFWTMGTTLLLSDPIPLREVFPHLREGERPFTIGFSTIEAFRNYPAGDVEQSSGIQEEINLVANQRLDNVKLVLNKRYYVKRGSQVDLDALIRNVPGGGVMMNDPEKDVQTVDTRDVTGSSYQEQDRLSVEMDDLIGSFSQSSVQSNKNLNETVGGMDAMQSGAGAVQDYGLRIFFETWVEPTIRQLVRLVQYYETDQNIMALAEKNSKIWQRFGIAEVTDELLKQELTVQVNVGIGNTDPQKRVEKLMFGVKNVAGLPGQSERMKSAEIADEVFGTLGYKNATRFFRNDEEQTQHEKENPPQPPLEVQLAQMDNERQTKDNEARDAREKMKLEMEAQTRFAKLALEKGFKLDDLMQALDIAKMDDKTTRQKIALDNVVKMQEHELRRETGAGV